MLLEVVIDGPQPDDLFFLVRELHLGDLPGLLQFLNVGLLPAAAVGSRNAVLG